MVNYIVEIFLSENILHFVKPFMEGQAALEEGNVTFTSTNQKLVFARSLRPLGPVSNA